MRRSSPCSHFMPDSRSRGVQQEGLDTVECCGWMERNRPDSDVLGIPYRARERAEGGREWKRGTGPAGAASRGTRNATAENTSREIHRDSFGTGGLDWTDGMRCLAFLGSSGAAAQAGKICGCTTTAARLACELDGPGLDRAAGSKGARCRGQFTPGSGCISQTRAVEDGSGLGDAYQAGDFLRFRVKVGCQMGTALGWAGSRFRAGNGSTAGAHAHRSTEPGSLNST